MRTIPVIGLPLACTDYAGAVEWILGKAAAPNTVSAVEAANTHVAALARSDKAFGRASFKTGDSTVTACNARADFCNKITRMFEIAPSILSADFTRLAEEMTSVKNGGAKILHVDVMDGHFVPNITIGLPVVKSIRKATDMTIDTHLMIAEPGRYAVEFVKAGADMVSVHVEADPHLQRTLTAIRDAGAKAGIAINPATPIETLTEALPYSDFVLLMSVNPGFGGQTFIPTMLDKLRRLMEIIH